MRVVSKTGTDRLVDFITALALAWPSNRLGLRVIVSLCVRGTRGAIRVTLDDLQILIQEGEGTTLEFKESLSSSFARELVALANTIGGKILLGVRDDGTVVGVQDTNTLRARIQDIARNCDHPVQVLAEPVGGVFAVHVRESSAKPVQCSEGFFWRQGAVTQKLSRDEIRDLFRLEGVVRFDLAPCVRFSYPEDFDREKFDVWLSLSRHNRPADFIEKAGTGIRRIRNETRAQGRPELIEMTVPDKPRSRNQRYRLTPEGREFLRQTQEPQ